MAQPTISAISPSVLPANAGGVFTITGTNFNTTNVTAVTVNGTPAQFTIASATELTVTSPTAAAGAATVTVTNSDGTATDSTKLTISSYTLPNRYFQVGLKGVFPTDGIGHLNVDGLYAKLDGIWGTTTAQGKYADYLKKTAKIAAIKLHNTRYEPDLTVPNYS